MRRSTKRTDNATRKADESCEGDDGLSRFGGRRMEQQSELHSSYSGERRQAEKRAIEEEVTGVTKALGRGNFQMLQTGQQLLVFRHHFSGACSVIAWARIEGQDPTVVSLKCVLVSRSEQCAVLALSLCVTHATHHPSSHVQERVVKTFSRAPR